MRAYAISRLLDLAIDLAVLSIALFALSKLLPVPCVNHGSISVGGFRTPICVEQTDRNSLPVQYLDMVSRWVRGDFGLDTQGHPVLPIVLGAVPYFLFFVVLCYIVVQLLAVPIAVVWTARRDSPIDGLFKALSWVGIATPAFLVVLALFVLQANGVPVVSSSFGRNYVLPITIVAFFWVAVRARLLRESLGRIVDEPYMRTARAKGLRVGTRMFKHALRNAGPAVPGDNAVFAWILVFVILASEPAFDGRSLLSLSYNESSAVSLCAVGVMSIGILLTRFGGDLVNAWLNPALRRTMGFPPAVSEAQWGSAPIPHRPSEGATH